TPFAVRKTLASDLLHCRPFIVTFLLLYRLVLVTRWCLISSLLFLWHAFGRVRFCLLYQANILFAFSQLLLLAWGSSASVLLHASCPRAGGRLLVLYPLFVTSLRFVLFLHLGAACFQSMMSNSMLLLLTSLISRVGRLP